MPEWLAYDRRGLLHSASALCPGISGTVPQSVQSGGQAREAIVSVAAARAYSPVGGCSPVRRMQRSKASRFVSLRPRDGVGHRQVMNSLVTFKVHAPPWKLLLPDTARLAGEVPACMQTGAAEAVVIMHSI
jgi:hypothetical protein